MSGGDEGEAPNSRCGGSCPTASLLALPLSHPPVSGSSTSTPWTTNEGRAEQSVRWLMPDGLTTRSPFPGSHFLTLHTLDYQ